MKQIILIGSGGHANSCIDVIKSEGKFKIYGFVSNEKSLKLSYPLVGNDTDLSKVYKKCKNAIISIGSIKNPKKRIKIFKLLKKLNFKLPVIKSPNSYISPSAKIDEGSIIMHHVLINSNSVIGKNCILNTKSLIEHDVTIGDNVHISTAAVINGSVTVEDNTFIGSNATIKHGVKIGKNCVISAGAFLNKNLKSGSLFK